MSPKVVFVDRDGVLNATVERDGKLVSPRLFKDFLLLDGVPEAISSLRHQEYEVVVVTNQPDISRGLMLQSELDQMTDVILNLGVSDVLICPHSDQDVCNCRKPKPGLLTRYLESLKTRPTELWMIGDQEVDMEAGRACSACLIQIVSEVQEELIAKDRILTPSLKEAVSFIGNRSP